MKGESPPFGREILLDLNRESSGIPFAQFKKICKRYQKDTSKHAVTRLFLAKEPEPATSLRPSSGVSGKNCSLPLFSDPQLSFIWCGAAERGWFPSFTRIPMIWTLGFAFHLPLLAEGTSDQTTEKSFGRGKPVRVSIGVWFRRFRRTRGDPRGCPVWMWPALR